MTDKILKQIEYSIEKLRRYTFEDILIIHHDDADGITSGAIIYEALRREGFDSHLICIEKLMPQVIKYIHEKKNNSLIFYVDIGSPHADKISMYNKSRNLVIILDHHDPKPSTDEMVININPEFYGFSGEIDASGSIMTYLFAKSLNSNNIDLSRIALIGAQELPSQDGYFVKQVYEDVKNVGLNINLKDMFRILQIFGPVGYYQDGPKLGIKACLEGVSEDILKTVKELEERRKSINKRMLAILYRGGLRKERYIQWFDSGDLYRGMGTKVIGTFCSYLKYQRRLIDPDKYIIGMMNMPNEILGLMELDGKWVKISGRVPDKIKNYIDNGKYPGIVDVMVETAEALGGVGDGHLYAASVVVPADEKINFIKELDKKIGDMIKQR